MKEADPETTAKVLAQLDNLDNTPSKGDVQQAIDILSSFISGLEKECNEAMNIIINSVQGDTPTDTGDADMDKSPIQEALNDADSTDRTRIICKKMHDYYSDLDTHLDNLRVLDVELQDNKEMQDRVRNCIHSLGNAKEHISEAIDDLEDADTDIIEDIGNLIEAQ